MNVYAVVLLCTDILPCICVTGGERAYGCPSHLSVLFLQCFPRGFFLLQLFRANLELSTQLLHLHLRKAKEQGYKAGSSWRTGREDQVAWDEKAG